MSLRFRSYLLPVLALASVGAPSAQAQRIVIDWQQRQQTACPSEAGHHQSVPVLVRNLNDVLYTNDVSLDVRSVRPADFLNLPVIPNAGKEFGNARSH